MTDTIIRIERFMDDGKCTIGRLYVNDDFVCHTLEDTYRQVKKKGETRIPQGGYRLTARFEGGFYQRYIKRFAPWHRGMIWVRDVPDFEYILFHPGNTEEDTQGCILTGVWHKPMTFIAKSAKTYERLYKQVVNAVEAGRAKLVIEDHDRPQGGGW